MHTACRCARVYVLRKFNLIRCYRIHTHDGRTPEKYLKSVVTATKRRAKYSVEVSRRACGVEGKWFVKYQQTIEPPIGHPARVTARELCASLESFRFMP